MPALNRCLCEPRARNGAAVAEAGVMKRWANHLWLGIGLYCVVCVSVVAQQEEKHKALLQRARQYEPLMQEAAARHGIEARLLWVIAYLETRFQSQAVSPKGARGLMQFMPATAARYGLSDAHDPTQAIDAAARYVRDLLRRYNGRVDLALAAYNAGEATVDAYLTGRTINTGARVINAERQQTNGIPPYAETRAYVWQGMKLLGLTAQQPRLIVQRKPLAATPSSSSSEEEEEEEEVKEVESSLPRGLVRQSLFAQSLIETATPAINRSLFFIKATEPTPPPNCKTPSSCKNDATKRQ